MTSGKSSRRSRNDRMSNADMFDSGNMPSDIFKGNQTNESWQNNQISNLSPKKKQFGKLVNQDIENLVGGYFKKKDRLKRTESFDVSLVNQSESVDRSIPSF